MKWEVFAQPSYTALKVELDPGEEIIAEPGAYLMNKGELQVDTSTMGVLSAFKRAFLGGESFFLNKFRAVTKSELWLVPSYPGDIRYIQLSPSTRFYVQDGAFLAMHGNIKIDVAWRGVRGLLAQGEIFWLKLEGAGGVWVSSYGAIVEKEVGINEIFRVDNNHLVAMTDMRWKITKLGGLKTFFLGGEGLIVEVEGPGKIYIQTRSLPMLAKLITDLIPKR
jgi:uncharacterized protein (TIGR00266 family)